MAAILKADEVDVDPSIQIVQVSIEQLATGLSELRADVRELRGKQEADTRELRNRIDAVDTKIDAKIGDVRTEIGAVRNSVTELSVKLESSLRRMTVGWFLTIGGILGVMAKGFHWI